MTVFRGCMPALMTPCDTSGKPNYDALVSTASHLIAEGMSAVVYCGSMGDWPLLTDQQRQEGVRLLVSANIPVIVGTGSQNTTIAESHAAHAARMGAAGLMIIPRLLSRGTSRSAQKNHFSRVLHAGDHLPAVIYNSPVYGFTTDADLFFELHTQFPSLVGFKEFGGPDALTYAAEHITNEHEELSLMVGVDTQVLHGAIHCGATGAITGVGNALPKPVLRLLHLCRQAADGNKEALQLARELDQALHILATFDEGPDLVLFYKRLMVLNGHLEYSHQIDATDTLSDSQRVLIDKEWQQFSLWWESWRGTC